MMLSKIWFLPAIAVMVAVSASAQKSGYAGQESRAIKSLDPDQIHGYREGLGMGLAKAAELNGYPGPMHVLELKDELNLTREQEKRVTGVFNRMKREAKELGRELIRAEEKLEMEFRSNKADPWRVQDLTAFIGTIHSKLRASHLNAHVATKPLLTPAQVARYKKIRGYR